MTAAGAVLDRASLVASTVDIPGDACADLRIRAGFLTLRHGADVFQTPYDPAPRPGGRIRVTLEDIEEGCECQTREGAPRQARS